PPSSTSFKLNTDDFAQLSSGHDGICGVICDSSGTWIMGFASYHFSHGSMESELFALYHGLKLSFIHGYKPIEVKVDAQTIINFLPISHPLYTNIINDCRFLLAQLDDPAVLYTYREQNQVADLLAKFGSQLESSTGLIVYTQPPRFVTTTLEVDR
ncbi:hypothetical protein A4A49_56177, partial [Nicotiana attenuata]